ncbi:MAG: AAA family ATPase [Actinobacteria bacterium]|nr:AAA family ATPase [Actinomycetota bacterium]
MAADRDIVEALEQVLRAQPSATLVRTHLVRTLLDGGDAESALTHCDTLLQEAPNDPAVLRLVADVCDAAGQPGRAATTRMLADAMSPLATPVDTRPQPLAERAAAAAPSAEPLDVFGDPVDQFVRDVQRQHDQEFVRLADVAGLDSVKRRIRSSFLEPLQRPDLQIAYGKTVRGGLLLWGPPGCGKTFLARAIAGELGANFLPVAIHDIISAFYGESERNLHEVFEEARRLRPSVLFFDEVDALGMARVRQQGGTLHNVVAVMLSELDGIGASNEGLFILAATNQPWDVDPALRRPGRFDRTVLVLPPDHDARKAILELHLRGRPVERLNLDKIAKAADGYSGADLKLVCDDAVEGAMSEAFRTGELQPVTQQHLERALAAVKPSLDAWFDTARNYATYANSSGDYDELGAHLRRLGRR